MLERVSITIFSPSVLLSSRHGRIILSPQKRLGVPVRVVRTFALTFVQLFRGDRKVEPHPLLCRPAYDFITSAAAL